MKCQNFPSFQWVFQFVLIDHFGHQIFQDNLLYHINVWLGAVRRSCIDNIKIKLCINIDYLIYNCRTFCPSEISSLPSAHTHAHLHTPAQTRAHSYTPAHLSSSAHTSPHLHIFVQSRTHSVTPAQTSHIPIHALNLINHMKLFLNDK